jgi:hypothetical protein
MYLLIVIGRKFSKRSPNLKITKDGWAILIYKIGVDKVQAGVNSITLLDLLTETGSK